MPATKVPFARGKQRASARRAWIACDPLENGETRSSSVAPSVVAASLKMARPLVVRCRPRFSYFGPQGSEHRSGSSGAGVGRRTLGERNAPRGSAHNRAHPLHDRAPAEKNIDHLLHDIEDRLYDVEALLHDVEGRSRVARAGNKLEDVLHDVDDLLHNRARHRNDVDDARSDATDAVDNRASRRTTSGTCSTISTMLRALGQSRQAAP
jgi:hypothetical protein